MWVPGVFQNSSTATATADWDQRIPVDITAVVCLTVAVYATVFVPALEGSATRVVVGLLFGLFGPGYVVVAALFPESSQHCQSDSLGARSPSTVERVGLAVLLSVSIIPIIGITLSVTPVGFRLVPAVVSVTGFTILGSVVAMSRWLALPPGERYRLPYVDKLQSGESRNPRTVVVNLFLAVSILLATLSVGFAVAFPQDGEATTELYLLTESENGGLVAENYPTDIAAGSNRTIHVGVGNSEDQSMNYEVVVLFQRTVGENASKRVAAERTVERWTWQLSNNESHTRPVTVAPETPTTDARLQVLLYKQQAPATPGADSAYRSTHIWFNVSEPSTSSRRMIP